MEKSTTILEEISTQCLSHMTIYKYSKHLKKSEKYKKGRIAASSWLNELIYHFIKKESNFLLEFKEHIENQKKELKMLNDGDYKQGLYDELNIIEDLLNDRSNRK